jgi:hypothetical protein
MPAPISETVPASHTLKPPSVASTVHGGGKRLIGRELSNYKNVSGLTMLPA